MDIFLYLLIIIGLTIFIIFFGGHNYQNKIEYDTNYFSNLNSVILFENKINELDIENLLSDKNFININEHLNSLNTLKILIPNFINCFLIKIQPHKIFNIYHLVDKNHIKNHMMILFNNNFTNNIELLIEDHNESNNYNYFYSLTKIISIVGIHHLYNNSNKEIFISCFILKKPFWHK